MEEDEEESKCATKKEVSVVSSPQMSPGFQLDPISAFFLLPILPLIYLFNLQSQLMNQMSQSTNRSSGSKITQITRDGNSLTIVEKYL